MNMNSNMGMSLSMTDYPSREGRVDYRGKLLRFMPASLSSFRCTECLFQVIYSFKVGIADLSSGSS